MPGLSLPILTLAVREQRYSCHGCGNCCRDFTVQLREDDLAKLRQQRWAERLSEPVTVEFRGTTFLRQKPDGACVFLMDDGRCRIHAEFGFQAKPLACQLFPFSLMPGSRGIQMGINFACQSVLENKGAALPTHQAELRRMGGQLPELSRPAVPPLLTDRLRATPVEAESLIAHVDAWLRRGDVTLSTRVDGLAWIAASLGQAKLAGVRGHRWDDLLDVLFTALPEELPHHPVVGPTARQRSMLRRAVFARIENPKLSGVTSGGRWRTTISQLGRERRMARGAGAVPRPGQGWPEGTLMEAVDGVGPARDPTHATAIDDLMTRCLRASVLGGRCWGAGYYGWPMIRGLQALALNVIVIGWLARLHAAGRSLPAIDIDAVRAAIGRVDRTAGRAPWLGGVGERWRLRWLATDHGLRRLLAAYPLDQPPRV